MVPLGRYGHAWIGFLELIRKYLDLSWNLYYQNSIIGELPHLAVSYFAAVQGTSKKSLIQELHTVVSEKESQFAI